MIPVCDLRVQYAALKEEIDAAMQGVAAAGQYIMGPNVKAFEREIADYCGCAHGIGVNSGTDALHLALRALHIGPGDEVITTPFTFVATTEAIGMVGATPVFVDIEAGTFNLDPAKIEAAITPRTKALLPVHIFGQPCDMDPLHELAGRYGLWLIEDGAQALGAGYRGQRMGNLGDVGCLSFFPSKNLGAMGDAGMVVTNNPEIADRVEFLRRHGGKVKYHHSELGLNSRLDELHAAILRVKLRHLDRWIDARRAHAYAYNAEFADMPGLRTPVERVNAEERSPSPEQVFPAEQLLTAYHQYTVLVDDRDALQQQLKAREVQSMVYYPVPLHLQEVHAGLNMPAGSFPQAEYVAAHCLSLPLFPEMTVEQRQAVTAAVREALAERPVMA